MGPRLTPLQHNAAGAFFVWGESAVHYQEGCAVRYAGGRRPEQEGNEHVQEDQIRYPGGV
ncbi:hypothetical protein [Paenibacillus sp. FSL K6-2862]|uniref:hypothetical protein n=1 Tax=Paenibacillus sp. FSL K6-2862 TaxID=2921484 RepID=UPI0030F7F3CB